MSCCAFWRVLLPLLTLDAALAPRAVAAAARTSRASGPCFDASALDSSRLNELCPSTLAEGGACQSRLLSNVCFVQETVVFYDSASVRDLPWSTGEEQLLDFGSAAKETRWQFLPLTPDKVDALLGARQRAPRALLLPRSAAYGELHSRYAVAEELSGAPSFDNCSLPLVLWTRWAESYGEAFERVPVLFNLLPALRNATVALAAPLKLPAPPFYDFLLRPFLHERAPPVVSFAQLSASGACFARALLISQPLALAPAEGESGIAAAARAIQAHYAPRLRASPWRSRGGRVTRVVIGLRPRRGDRSLTGVRAALHQCGREPGMECRSHVFGGSQMEDLSVMAHADVLVSLHGSGEYNALFMPPHSSLLELRGPGFGTRFRAWPNGYWPATSAQTNFSLFFWGINVEDARLRQPSLQEASGLEDRAAFQARDQLLRLQWHYLRPVLLKIAALKRDARAYSALHGPWGAGVLFRWQDGLLTQEPPVFCSAQPCAPGLGPLQCRPCEAEDFAIMDGLSTS